MIRGAPTFVEGASTCRSRGGQHPCPSSSPEQPDTSAVSSSSGCSTENYAGTLDQARSSGVVVGSAGTGRVASATRDDYATAIAAVLATAGHDNAVYELSGDTAWDFGELAAALATVLGRDVEYRSVSPEEHLAILTGAGLDEPTAGFVVALDGNIRDGALADATPDLSRLAGRPSTPLVDALREMAAGPR
jgi:NAD(P)H dehydrogenase (quinone)